MPPAADRFDFLFNGDPMAMAEAVASYEEHLFTTGEDLSLPILVLMVLDPHHPDRPFKPVMIPFTGDDVVALAGHTRRGQFGKVVAQIALGFHRLPAQVVRASSPFWREGERLLYAAFAAETVGVSDVPDYVTDFELDVPEQRQRHRRSLFACDGRGWTYGIERPDNGEVGPIEMMIAPVQADVTKPGRFLKKGPPLIGGSGIKEVGGLVPWGLDALATGYRRVFENEKVPCSDAKTSSRQRKNQNHRHARKRRG